MEWLNCVVAMFTGCHEFECDFSWYSFFVLTHVYWWMKRYFWIMNIDGVIKVGAFIVWEFLMICNEQRVKKKKQSTNTEAQMQWSAHLFMGRLCTRTKVRKNKKCVDEYNKKWWRVREWNENVLSVYWPCA